MNKKAKILVAVYSLVILVSVILNIALLCSPVWGTYTHTYEDGSKSKYTFYDNTYTYTSYDKNGDYTGYGGDFFKYVPKSKLREAEYNTLILGNTKYKRNSVFSFSYLRGSETVTYINKAAIFFQVLFPCLTVLSIIGIIMNKKNNNNNEERKAAKIAALEEELDRLKKDGE